MLLRTMGIWGLIALLCTSVAAAQTARVSRVGLVTDVGSILAHGSIVAREYGIPAVLGVGNGTVRIKHGQMLTIDGDSGTVLIHDEEQ